MLNGDSINGAGVCDEMMGIPKPGNSSIYYLSVHIPPFSPSGTFCLVVDMTGDGGLGEVISKNNSVNIDSLCGRMTTNRHGNGRDW
ncbi:MAG: hypothetical protein IPL24_00005 [Bacteroidetes bacterium]|nr:hypothetical protein [Bacteroidota bacterium]